jgi:hypothetical protein
MLLVVWHTLFFLQCWGSNLHPALLSLLLAPVTGNVGMPGHLLAGLPCLHGGTEEPCHHPWAPFWPAGGAEGLFRLFGELRLEAVLAHFCQHSVANTGLPAPPGHGGAGKCGLSVCKESKQAECSVAAGHGRGLQEKNSTLLSRGQAGDPRVYNPHEWPPHPCKPIWATRAAWLSRTSTPHAPALCSNRVQILFFFVSFSFGCIFNYKNRT